MIKSLVIRHRNRYSGPSEDDNNPYYINSAILEGYHVEIDLHYKNGQLYLGHDYGKYKIDLDFLVSRKKNLWIHAKTPQTLEYLTHTCSSLNYFYHNNDDYALTSQKFIWCHPRVKYIPKNGIKLDFSIKPDYNISCAGICVDYIK
jgi:hypothetical protein